MTGDFQVRALSIGRVRMVLPRDVVRTIALEIAAAYAKPGVQDAMELLASMDDTDANRHDAVVTVVDAIAEIDVDLSRLDAVALSDALKAHACRTRVSGSDGAP